MHVMREKVDIKYDYLISSYALLFYLMLLVLYACDTLCEMR